MAVAADRPVRYGGLLIETRRAGALAANETPVSLLERLRKTPDDSSWKRLARGRWQPRRSSQTRTIPTRRRRLARRKARSRRRPRTSKRRRTPRLEARQHLAGRRFESANRRLRLGAVRGRRRPDPVQRDSGHALVHGTRTDRRWNRWPCRRCLFTRRHSLRVPHRTPPPFEQNLPWNSSNRCEAASPCLRESCSPAWRETCRQSA